MTSRVGLIVFLWAAFLVIGSSANAAKPPKTEVWPVKAGLSQIVFVRNSKFADQPTFLYETTSGQPRFVGMINNKRKLVLDLPAGDHVFMIGSLPLCDFLQASVLPDKRYHVAVVARFPEGTTLRPVRNQGDGYLYTSEEFRNLLEDTTIAGRAPESIMKEEAKKAESFYKSKWAQWQTKTPEQKAVLTLHSADSEQ